MKNMNILVTGGAGFIGSNLIDQLLLLGHKVISLDNFDSFYDKNIKIDNLVNAHKHQNFDFIEGDIRDQTDLEKCFSLQPIDLVIHLAAKVGIRPSIEDPKSYYNVNVLGTLNILEVMRNYGVKKMLFASSSSVYGNNQKVPFSESDNVDYPISPYAASKKALELLCHTYHHLYNFDIFCLRLFTVYGPRQRPDLAIHKFTNLILNEEPIPVFGDGSTQRDYTYVDDIIIGIINSISKLKGFEVFNLGESQPISLNELILNLENLLNTKAKINYLPHQPGDVSRTFANIDKAKNILGYHPNTNIKEGLKIFTDWKEKSKSYL